MRRAITIAVLIAAVSIAPSPAPAKEGVVAKLARPVDLTAPAGTPMHVRWWLESADGLGFGGGGIYLRVHRCGRRTLTITAREEPGIRYAARFRMPKRIRKLSVGLPGWRMYQGRTERADAYFEFDPPLRRRCDERAARAGRWGPR